MIATCVADARQTGGPVPVENPALTDVRALTSDRLDLDAR